ncbi:MAG: hypothetical protein N4A33_00160 [Bacteriovoracaceae bacterium]|jgi:hypothetical protein|nr:hypothetical protein [Bacteriovoracaceae bacterium]
MQKRDYIYVKDAFIISDAFDYMIYRASSSYNKRAFIIDSPDNTSLKYLSLLDVYLLRKAALNIDNYLSEVDFSYFINGTNLNFSKSAYLNCQEIYRKLLKKSFPHTLVKKETFDADAMELMSELASLIIRDKNFKYQLESTIKRFHRIFPIVSEIIDFLAKEEKTSRCFYYLLQSSFKRKFSREVDEYLIYYLIVEVLSPRFELNHEGLAIEHKLLDLEKIIRIEKIGNRVTYLISNNNRYKTSFLYSSDCYEESCVKEPLFLEVYDSITFYSRLDETLGIKEKKIFIANYESIGSDFPQIELSFEKNNTVKCKLFYLRSMNKRKDEYVSKALEISYKYLKNIYYDLDRSKWYSSITKSNNKESLYRFNISKLEKIIDERIISNLKLYGPKYSYMLGQASYLGYLIRRVRKN